MKDSRPDLKAMGRRWPSGYVAREKVGEFTGGLLSPKYLANLDCGGAGPKDRVKVGKKIMYPVDSLISWLESRAQAMEGGMS